MTSHVSTHEKIAALVVQSKKGDASAFEQLIRLHLRAAVAVALAKTQCVEDAEDVAQDAFILAYEKLDKCREPSRFSGWLLQIVRNQALNWVSKRGRREKQTLLETHHAIMDSAESATMERQLLLSALSRLDTIQREIVLLHGLEGWTHIEIARHLSISEETSRWQLFTARKIMKSFMERSANQRKKVTHERL